MKKIVVFALISMFLFSFVSMAANPFKLDKLEPGLDNILYGSIETPDNINETNSKGTPAFSDCTDKTKDDVGRAIVRVVGGLYKLATFWYPED